MFDIHLHPPIGSPRGLVDFHFVQQICITFTLLQHVLNIKFIFLQITCWRVSPCNIRPSFLSSPLINVHPGRLGKCNQIQIWTLHNLSATVSKTVQTSLRMCISARPGLHQHHLISSQRVLRASFKRNWWRISSLKNNRAQVVIAGARAPYSAGTNVEADISGWFWAGCMTCGVLVTRAGNRLLWQRPVFALHNGQPSGQ